MANGVRGSYPILQKAVLRAWGGAEKAECSAALRGSRGKYKLASSASFAQFFLLCSSPLLHSVVGAATAKAWEHRKSKPEASMGIVGFP